MIDFSPAAGYDPMGNYEMMDLNKWYKAYEDNSGKIKCHMIHLVFRVIVNEFIRATKHGYGLDSCEMDLDTINYSHYCDIMGWPDLQDGGIFEQCIEEAGEMAIRNYWGFIPRWSKFSKANK